MNNSKSKNNDLITSRITVTFFVFALLSLLSWIYILPFKKHYLVINNYYQIIEIAVVSVTAILLLASIFYYAFCSKRKLNFSEKLITPAMLVMFSIPTFAAALLIPLSNNRTLMYKYCIAAFFAIFLAYALYYLVNKGFALYTAILTVNCFIFAFLDYMYTSNVTFSDKIPLKYPVFLILFIAFIIICNALVYLLSVKTKTINVLYTCILSAISLVGAIIRFFLTDYVSIITIVLLILALIAMILIDKKIIKLKK